MQTIYLLPDTIVAQIAAGEVIERPAYAVKELVDNAIDAGAKRISIDLIDSGLTKIVVTDDGMGMSKIDLLESYKLHTTSKIGQSDHLLGIKTLGFRGEALASIAAVSTLTIESKKRKDIIGTKIEIQHSHFQKSTSLGMPTGTRIIVQNLFSNIPARKKFVKSNQTELKHILDIITSYAVAHPEIVFVLSHQGKNILHIPKASTLLERLTSLYGTVVTNSLLPIHGEESYGSFQGFISTPQLSSRINPKREIIINTRPVTDKLINLAINEGYGILLERETQPTFFLHMTIPPELVDVNIHPRKEHVRFTNQEILFSSLTKIVEETLTSHNITFFTTFSREQKRENNVLLDTPLAKQLKNHVFPIKSEQLSSIPNSKNVIQVHNLYLVTQSKEGILFIDQHAAHERILYEMYSKTFFEEKNRNKFIQVKKTILLDIPLTDIAIVVSHKELFEKIGFHIEPFSGSTIRITGVPKLFEDRNIETFIRELLQSIDEEISPATIDKESKKMLRFLSCRSAVKAGDPLTKDQMVMIIEELEKIPGAATCPHGRPTKILVPLTDFHKLFKRT